METIVIQEQDEAIREILKLTIVEEGFNVQALKECDLKLLLSIDRSSPVLIILDFKISGKECIKTCRLIKDAYPNLPVLVMSCNSKIRNIYRNYSFDGYIEKPFDLDVLCRKVRRYALAAEKC